MTNPKIDENLLRAMAQAQGGSQYTPPTMLVDLPSRGLLYPEGHPLKGKEAIEIKYMTTKEEDILLNESFVKAGVVLDKVLESVLLDRNIKVDSLLNCDKTALQIACRSNAYGENYEFEYVCTNCEQKNVEAVNLNEIKHFDVDFQKISEDGGIVLTLPMTKAVVKAKVLAGRDDIEVQKRIKQKKKHNLPEEVLIERYRQIFISVNDNQDPLFISSFIKNMPLRDSKYFMKNYAAALPGVDFTFEAECSNCETINKGGVPVGLNFFYPEQ
tara:strand:- start:10626 stop:11438 length:813 start_codon:yes stop_codon:yes gene_type:complete